MVGQVEKMFEAIIAKGIEQTTCNNGVYHGKVFSIGKCWGACYKANKCDNYY
jgi:hypothetical protein